MYRNPPLYDSPGSTKHWTKHLYGVDPNIPDGWCFCGPFVKDRNRYTWNPGDFALQCRQYPNNGQLLADVRVVSLNAAGGWSIAFEETGLPWAGWARRVKDTILDIVGESVQTDTTYTQSPYTQPPSVDTANVSYAVKDRPSIKDYTSEELIRELTVRNISRQEIIAVLGYELAAS